MADIIQCDNCGERKKSASKYCPACSTAAGRQKMKEENDLIWKNNEKLGFINPYAKVV